ncbi:MAG TPA: pantoate--beta-alanine ligase [Lacipirellulaceae bacterium]|nr:pantoate--beta-alanine ligase [Lacipirellulaceae bacterium]
MSRRLLVMTRGDDIRAAVRESQSARQTVGFVPTMGALHEGHLSLVDAARRECDRVVVSIFVNPTQFGPHEDLDGSPRPLERALERLPGHSGDWAFVPPVDQMYPTGFDSFIDVGAVAKPWEGEARPGHFRGVATVVMKLLQLVPADRGYFGRKDYQQTLVVRQMVADFHVPTEIRVCPIVRDPDGLALSSRNVYLSADQRVQALVLRRSLGLAEQLHGAGERGVETIRRRMLAEIDLVSGVDVEYIAFMKEGTVEEVEVIDGPTTVAIAARVGSLRLIDNVCLS